MAVGMDIDHCFYGNGGYDVVCGLLMHAKTLEQLRQYVSTSAVPFIVKGVLSVQDAEKCAQAGVKGILVSHHHGIMPYSVPPLMVLPEIRRAVGNDMKIFVDCGIESGMDVFKALALGADAVCGPGTDACSERRRHRGDGTDRPNEPGTDEHHGPDRCQDVKADRPSGALFPSFLKLRGGYPMILGLSAPLSYNSAEEWAKKHKQLGCKAVVFPVDCTEPEDVIDSFCEAARQEGLIIAEVGIWKNALAADPEERWQAVEYSIGQLRMADRIGAKCCVNIAGTPCGPVWDGAYAGNFSAQTWDMAVEYIQHIIDAVQPVQTKFAIETMPWMIPTGPDEYLILNSN